MRKYVIYEISEPSVLTTIENDGYYPRSVHKQVLKQLDVRGIESEHDNENGAIHAIMDNLDKLKHLKLTIMPVYEVTWEGKLR